MQNAGMIENVDLEYAEFDVAYCGISAQSKQCEARQTAVVSERP
jgi:hypothetical protein